MSQEDDKQELAVKEIEQQGPAIQAEIRRDAKREMDKAKRLSVNDKFQQAVLDFRTRWGIEARVPEESSDAKTVLCRCTAHLSGEDQMKLDSELSEFARQFALDFVSEDRGLIIAGLCYGLTPETLRRYWGQILWCVISAAGGKSQIVVDRGDDFKKELTQQFVISYLFSNVQAGTPLPEPIMKVVVEAVKMVGLAHKPDEFLKPMRWLEEWEFSPRLRLMVEPTTTLEDVRNMWHWVRFYQVSLWGEPPKRRRTWRTYWRDTYIWRKVKIEGMTYEAAYDAWLSEQPYDEPVEISAIIKAVTRIDEM